MSGASVVLLALAMIAVAGAAFFYGAFVGSRRGSMPFIAHPEQWSIGIYGGPDPFRLSPWPGIRNPVLTAADVSDMPATFVADPFMYREDGQWYLFFEAVSAKTRKGTVALARSEDGLHWAYDRVVLREPFHLSYPFVFTWEGAYYMIPETSAVQAVRLYRAEAFPYGWKPVATLVHGDFSDPTLFRHEGRWYLFVSVWHSELHLFSADDLTGPWTVHPMSPLLKDNPHTARPGGRVVSYEGRLYRFTQDTYPIYGNQARAFEITELSPQTYAEREISGNPVVAASGAGWNAQGMHHVDPHQVGADQWIAAVDGFAGRKFTWRVE